MSKKNTMSVREAAAESGYTQGRIKQLIWAGECQAEKEPVPYLRFRFAYRIPLAEVRRLTALKAARR